MTRHRMLAKSSLVSARVKASEIPQIHGWNLNLRPPGPEPDSTVC
jgi:hypothetical protein